MVSAKLKSIELRCPNCGNEFVSKTVQPQDAQGRQHTDFHVQARGIEPLRYGVHQCAQCGFAGREEAFRASVGVSYEVQQRVRNELTPRLSMATPATSEKYEAAAKVAMWDGADAMNVADLWLRAAWCCLDEGDVEAERYYRRHAAWIFEDALESFDGIDSEERAKITYLVGELWRRIGDQARADAWFQRVLDESVSPTNDFWVDWSKRQRVDPSEWFV